MGKVGGGTLPAPNHRPFMTQESFDLLEYPFLTMKSFPSGFILHLGKKTYASLIMINAVLDFQDGVLKLLLLIFIHTHI